MDRLPCLSPSYRISSNLCPLSQWCHPIISSSVAPFSSCPQSFPASGSYNIELLFSWDDGGEHLKRAHYTFYKGFPSGSVVKKKKKKIHLQCRKCGSDAWVRKIPWRRKWQPTPVILPGKSHGQRSLVGFSPRGRKRVRHDCVTKNKTNTSYVSGNELNAWQVLFYFICSGSNCSPHFTDEKTNRDVKFPAQGHTGSTWDQNPCWKPMLLVTTLNALIVPNNITMGLSWRRDN